MKGEDLKQDKLTTSGGIGGGVGVGNTLMGPITAFVSGGGTNPLSVATRNHLNKMNNNNNNNNNEIANKMTLKNNLINLSDIKKSNHHQDKLKSQPKQPASQSVPSTSNGHTLMPLLEPGSGGSQSSTGSLSANGSRNNEPVFRRPVRLEALQGPRK